MRNDLPQGMWITAGIVLLLVVLAAFAVRRLEPAPVLHGATMGTTWTVRLAGLPPGLDERGLREGIESVLESVNAQMSTWREDSVLSVFNRLPAGGSIAIPDDLAMVLRAALELAEDSGGAYDPTVGPLVNLWGFGPDSDRDAVPPADGIAAARTRVGWQRLDWDRESRLLVQPGGLSVDLSSIAKGHAVDRVLEWVVGQGADGVLVEIGGEVRMQGRKPGGQPWRVALEPRLPGAALRVLEPGDRAVATSGTDRNAFEAGGRRQSHIIDPRTGLPVRHGLVAVTVLHDTCMLADALATALGVLGPDEGYDFAVQRGLAARFVGEQDGQPVERVTPAFRRLAEPARDAQ